MRHSSHGAHQVLPYLNLLPQPYFLLCLRPEESPNVTDTRHNLKLVPPKEGLRLRYVRGRQNQDALSLIQEAAAQGSSQHQIIKVTTYYLKGNSHPSVIRIPGMFDSAVGRP